MNYPKITIITPCYKMEGYLERTMQSVLNQQYPNLEYIVVDGGSTDGSVDIIRKYEKQLSSWISEPDNGMYDALNKGFQRSTGELMCWINADDVLREGALEAVGSLFTQLPEVEWVQGFPNVIDEKGKIFTHRPPRSSKWPFLLGDYRKDNIYIQQESTFWRRSLWEKSGKYIDTSYKLAGDFELWMRFFEYAPLYTSSILFGSFRVRPGQLSNANVTQYLEEADRAVAMYRKRLSPEDQKSLQFLENYRKYSNIIKRLPFKEKINHKYNKYFKNRNRIIYNAASQIFGIKNL